jgi:hypothetical protein
VRAMSRTVSTPSSETGHKEADMRAPRASTTDPPIPGVLALGPVRGAVESLQQLLALPEFATDMIVIVGDASESDHKRETYHEIFSMLGQARRSVVWIPGPVDGPLERDVRRAYETAKARPPTRHGRILLLTADAPPADVGPAAEEILAELMHTFEPRLAARVERPALFMLRDRGRSEWLEL